MAYFAVAQNDAVGRVRYQLLEVSILLVETDMLAQPLTQGGRCFRGRAEDAPAVRAAAREGR